MELLKRQPPAGGGHRAVATLDRQVTYVRHLMDKMVDASRLSKGRVSLARETLGARTIVRSAVETIMPALDARQQHLVMTMADDEIVVDADRTRLQGVLSNLLNNASKYGSAGGNVWLTTSAGAGALAISVRDDGVGIEAAALPNIFELVTQATETDHGGIGIGLSVVRSLVVAHGGTVEARSGGRGQGSELIVRLPLAP